MKTSQRLDAFAKQYRVKHLVIAMPDEGNEPSFNTDGCQICDDGLANDTYTLEVLDWRGKTGRSLKSLGDFEVCHECLCVHHNGE